MAIIRDAINMQSIGEVISQEPGSVHLPVEKKLKRDANLKTFDLYVKGLK